MDKVAAGAGKAAAGVEQLPAAMDKTGASTSRLTDIVKGSGVFKLIEKGVNAVVAVSYTHLAVYERQRKTVASRQKGRFGSRKSCRKADVWWIVVVFGLFAKLFS